MDPQTDAAQEALDKGTEALQQGDLQSAEKFYKMSLDIKETSIGALRRRGAEFSALEAGEEGAADIFTRAQVTTTSVLSGELLPSLLLPPPPGALTLHPARSYQLSDLPSAITSFESSIRLTPSDVKAPEIPEDASKPLPMLSPAQIVLADTHTNLGAAYILSTPPRPDKALEHLQEALMLSPEDGEVRPFFFSRRLGES